MNLKKHVHENLYKIRGFMHPADATMFNTLLAYHRADGIKGGLAEIGVFYGRSLSMLGLSAREANEKVLGIDLFDIPGQIEYVGTVLKSNGIGDAVILEKGRSELVSEQSIRERIGPVRFFHIDGGHEYEHLQNDAMLAASTLDQRGVIVFDDFMNPQYPDLTVAVIDFLRGRPEFVPFALTKSKLYVCRKGEHAAYHGVASTQALAKGYYIEAFSLLENPVIYLNQSIVNRGVYQKLAGLGLGRFAEKFAFEDKRRFTRQ